MSINLVKARDLQRVGGIFHLDNAGDIKYSDLDIEDDDTAQFLSEHQAMMKTCHEFKKRWDDVYAGK